MNQTVDIEKFHELKLQKAIQKELSDPSVIWLDTNREEFQILSPGKINTGPGPDFKDISILKNGKIFVGDAEFDKKSSYWKQHGHEDNPLYDNVILHIIFAKNKELNNSIPALLLDKNKLDIAPEKKETDEEKPAIDTLEDLQKYALLRLLRKSSMAQSVIDNLGISSALNQLTRDFLERYNNKKRRPVYNKEKLGKLIKEISKSKMMDFLTKLDKRNPFKIQDYLNHIVKTKLSIEGPHLRKELALNVLLPLSLNIAGDFQRTDIFIWFWSMKAGGKYGILSRRFPDISQEYIWQQQGMLEYIYLHGRVQNTVEDENAAFKLPDLIDFYESGLAFFEDPRLG